MSCELHILTGTIASGKSTYSQMMALNGALIVDCDSVVNMYHGGRYKLYDHDNKQVYKDAEEMMVRVALKAGKTVVINRLNHKRKTRQRWIDLAKEYNAKSVIVKFKWEAPEIHAERRMKHDSRGLTFERWLGVAMKKAEEREWVDPEIEKADKIITYERNRVNEYE